MRRVRLVFPDAAMVEARADALFISDYGENRENRKLIADLTAAHRLPSLHSLPGYVDAGGPMEHAADISALYRLSASSIARISGGSHLVRSP